MEQKLNIAEILKNKPRGTKLYSMIHGKCSFEAVTDEIFKINFCTSKFGLTQSGECTLIKFGNMYDGGECIIFPSKEMRDWSKFQWEKGDVLISNDGGTEVIFDKWYDDTYTSFYCKHYLNSEDKNKIVYYEEFLCTTERYRNYPTLSDEDRDKVSIGSFMDCAKWMREEFLKDLWHHASEKPNIKQGECCVTCLVKFKNESTELCVYFRNPEGWVCDDMSPKDFKRNFKGWLYIDDLLPKKGD